jgi:capsule biosynthesis phosphatase
LKTLSGFTNIISIEIKTMIQTFIIDIDDTIMYSPLNDEGKYDYDKSMPMLSSIERIRLLKDAGHSVILFTARGMRTFEGNVKKIKAEHETRLVNWLKEHEVPYDSLVFGKPWGPNPIYVDNRNLSLHAFVTSAPEFFEDIIKAESKI